MRPTALEGGKSNVNIGQPFPHFQAIADLNRQVVSGYEALARTLDESGHVISLGPLFSDPAVDREALLGVDRDVRYKALQCLAERPGAPFIFLNISPEWMQRVAKEGVVPTIRMVEELGIDPRRVVIEFVESAGTMSAMKHLVKAYRRAGMRIAVDDFGAGHSDLGRIIALEPDIIKLDMVLLKNAMAGGVLQDALQGIAQLVRHNGCELLCEGVETEEELRFALDHGARYVQGYFLWRPQGAFISAAEASAKLSGLLQRYLGYKVSRERIRQQFIGDMEQFLMSLRTAFTHDGVDFTQLPLMPAGMLRVYLCRADGVQESPNYEATNAGGWYTNTENIGHNWCTRPYFHQVLAAIEPGKKPILSTVYRDIGSGKMCQTLGLLLDDNHILFADIRYYEDEQLHDLPV